MDKHLDVSPDGTAAALGTGPAPTPAVAPAEPARHATLLAASALFVLVLLLVAAALAHLRPAAPGADPTAPSAFSAARALEDVRAVARATHPTGSAENARVRDYLADRLRSMGLAPEAQSGQVFNAREGVLGSVTNLVARLPGRERGAPALLLAAHYDSAPTSPGAADDGASVAAILETVRLLKAGPALRNDVVVLLTDGEEPGLLGSQLFVERLAAAAAAGQGGRIGAVLNFEYRGDRGPVWLFETSPGNGRLVDAWRQAVPHPVGNSLLSEVYRVLPNDTDMTSFRRGGLPGLNFAAGQGYLAYHTQRDTVDALDPASLQHMGDTMLGLARRLGDEDLVAVRTSDAVYFDAPVLGAVSYESALALPLQLVALGLLAAAFVRRRKAVRTGRVFAAVPVLVLAIVLVAVACQLAWMGVWLAHPGYQLLLHGATYNGDLYLGAFAALGVALFVVVLRLVRRWFTAPELRLAALTLVAFTGLLMAIALPGASYLVTWPALPFLLLAAFSREEAPTAPRRAAWLALAVVPAVLLFAPVVQLLFDALTPQNLFAMAGMLGLACVIALPVVDLLTRRYVLPLVPALIAVGLLAMGTATSGFDAAHPRPDNLFFVQDADAHTARWVSDDDALDAYTSRVIGADAKRTPVSLLGPMPVPLWVHDAPALDVPAPQVTVVEDRVVDGLRRIALDVSSPRGAARLVVRAEDIEVRESRVAGLAYRPRNPRRWDIEADGLGTAPVRVELAVPPAKPFALRVRDIDFALPPNTLGARPADAMAQPFRGSDTTQVLRVVKFAG